MTDHRANLVSIYQAAMAAVDGEQCVIDWLHQHAPYDFQYIVAIGKAAGAMTSGAFKVLSEQVKAAFVISRDGAISEALVADNRVQFVAAGHPTPDQSSLDAGAALIAFLDPISAPVLFLISGGSSALVESLPDNLTLAELQQVNNWLLGSGLAIHSINAVRSALSQLKGGGLLAYVQNRHSQVLLISDVIGDDPAVIGSGLLCPANPISGDELEKLPDWIAQQIQIVATVPPLASSLLRHHIIANADRARKAACNQAQRQGYQVIEHQHYIQGDVNLVAEQLIHTLTVSPSFLHIWSGEPTVKLPVDPGRGGRCQALALTVGLGMTATDHKCWYLLAAGTDGCDGNGEAAGAVVDAASIGRIESSDLDPCICLREADSGHCLDISGDLLASVHTGTNVMDVILGLNLPPS